MPAFSGHPDVPGNAIAIMDGELRIARVNTGFARLLGHDGAQALGRRPSELLCGPDTDTCALDALRTAAASGQELQTALRVYAGDGRALWVTATVSALHGAMGAPRRVALVLRDTAHAPIHEALRNKVLDAMAHGAPLRDAALLLCREVEKSAPDVIAVLLQADADGHLRLIAAPSLPPALDCLAPMANDGQAQIAQCDCRTAAATGEPVLTTDIASDPRWAPVRERFMAHGLQACSAHPIIARDGTVIGVLVFYYRDRHRQDALHEPLAHASLHLCALLLERERERAHIHQLAHYDALTGLANRGMLNAQAARMLHEAQRNAAPLALVFIDLDHFKQTNDTQGHLAGDALLRAVAQRLQDGARASDVAARLGGDEFVLLLTHCDTRQAAVTAERLLAAIVQPVPVNGVTLYPRASVGIAMFPEDGDDPDTLLHCADVAMYRAKIAGGQRWCFHSTTMDDRARKLSLLEADLCQALRTGALALHYQPQLRGTALHGVEALLRWTHPLLGPIAPEHLARTVGECGMSAALTQWVLHEACRQMADWRARGIAVPRVSVNLQAGDFLDPGLPEVLAGALAAHGLQPSALVVETTEEALSTPDANALATARAVHERGIALALDNFGTGYSSLGTLHLLPINELKLDRSFVHDIETSATARALTGAMLHIARGLDLDVVAEGVETAAQQQFLRTHGCKVLQGYLLSPPLPAEALESWLAQHGHRA